MPENRTLQSETIHRQLTAVLCADIVGFSHLTEIDEDATFIAVREYLDRFAKTIEEHNGEVIKYSGDAVLATFSSATDALVCSVQVQKNIADRNVEQSDEQNILFRIGLNLGDIIFDRNDIFGDGVNLAARLEALCDPGGICVSESLHNAVAKKLPFDFEFIGEKKVKNISKPIRVYRVNLHDDKQITTPNREPSAKPVKADRRPTITRLIALVSFVLALGLWSFWSSVNHTDDKPVEVVTPSQQTSIIVLPFLNMSSDVDQNYFADGITEDIITDLSHLSNLKVLARNTSFGYKGKTVNPQLIGKELQVTHLLEGSVRRSGENLRINVQLIDTSNGHHVWAERYDRKLIDVFSVQDELNRNIVSALTIQLTKEEETELEKDTTISFEAYDLFLQGLEIIQRGTEKANQQAQEIFRNVIELDPSYARAYGALALAKSRSVNVGWIIDSPVETRDRALELARKAVRLDNNSQHAYFALSFTHLSRQEFSEAAEAAKRSFAIAPNYADGYAMLGFINNTIGKPKEAIRLVEKATLLNPHYTWYYLYNFGRAYYALGNYELAIEKLLAALGRNANSSPVRLFLAASYVGINDIDEAQWQIDELLMDFPNISLSFLSKEPLLVDTEQHRTFIDHLRIAGLTE